MKYYSKEAIKALKKTMVLSPSTRHKINHLYCPKCLAERSKAMVKHG
jgi:hypothetical protein